MPATPQTSGGPGSGGSKSGVQLVAIVAPSPLRVEIVGPFPLSVHGLGGGGGGPDPNKPPEEPKPEMSRRQRAEEAIAQALEGQLDRLARLNAALDPSTLQQMAARRKAIAQAEEQYEKAMKKAADAARWENAGFFKRAEILRGQIAAGVGKAGTWIGLAQSGFQTATGIAQAARDPFLTGGQRAQHITESIPIVGGLMKSLHDFGEAVTGVTATIAKAMHLVNVQAVEARAQGEADRAIVRLQAQISAASNRADTLERVPTRQVPQGNRRTFAGELAYQEQRELAPLYDARARAEAELAAAREQVASIKGQTRPFAKRHSGLRLDAEHALADMEKAREADEKIRQDRFLPPGEGPLGQVGDVIVEKIGGWFDAAKRGLGFRGDTHEARVQGGTEAQKAIVALEQNRVTLLQQEQALQQANLSVAEKESALRKTNINIAKTELSQLERRHSIMTGLAKRLGDMTEPESRIKGEAALFVQKHGLARSTPIQRQFAREISPEWYEQLTLERGKNMPMFEKLRKAGIPLTGETNIDKLRQEIQAKEFQVRMAVNIDEAKLARAIAEAMKAEFPALEGLIKERVRVAIDEFKVGFGLQQANR